MQHHDLSPRAPDAAVFPAEPTRTSAAGTLPPLTASPDLNPVCGRCGSDALVRDACAVWSVPEQRWELAGTYDSTTCQDCEAEADDLADWRPLALGVSRRAAPAYDQIAMIYHPGTGTLLAADEAVIVRLAPPVDDDDAEDIAARLHATGGSLPLGALALDAGTRRA